MCLFLKGEHFMQLLDKSIMQKTKKIPVDSW